MEVHRAPTEDATMEGRKERTIWNELESDCTDIAVTQLFVPKSARHFLQVRAQQATIAGPSINCVATTVRAILTTHAIDTRPSNGCLLRTDLKKMASGPSSHLPSALYVPPFTETSQSWSLGSTCNAATPRHMEGRKERTIWNELESDWVRWLKRPFRSKDETTSPMSALYVPPFTETSQSWSLGSTCNAATPRHGHRCYSTIRWRAERKGQSGTSSSRTGLGG
jgi:hypothetical protein